MRRVRIALLIGIVIKAAVVGGWWWTGLAAARSESGSEPAAPAGMPADLFAYSTDNGVPFATAGLHGLSQLNVWWLRLGIQHQSILPAYAQQNGSHERMHKTLKREALRPPRAHVVAQQRAFNAFRRRYNEERPHDALSGRPPAVLYRPSARPYTGTLPPIDYPGHFIVKRVTDTPGRSSSAGSANSSSSPRRSSSIPWASRRSMTGSGRSTSARCGSGTSTNATTFFTPSRLLKKASLTALA